MSEWQSIDSAPRSGAEFLACRHNGASWEFYVVYFVDHPGYPWAVYAGDNALAEGRLDYWRPLEPPHPA